MVENWLANRRLKAAGPRVAFDPVAVGEGSGELAGDIGHEVTETRDRRRETRRGVSWRAKIGFAARRGEEGQSEV